MFKLIRESGWITGILIFFMPIFGIYFFGSQMGYSQVQGKFAEYDDIPEFTQLSEITPEYEGQVVMLRGTVGSGIPAQGLDGLVVYQERPNEGREVRFREEFDLFFPTFDFVLADGTAVLIQPSETKEGVISHEPHRIQAGPELDLTGFRAGDVATVQGEWLPDSEYGPALIEATGMTSIDKATLLLEGEEALKSVGQIRNILGILTLSGIILIVAQLRRAKAKQKNGSTKETEEWQTQTATKTKTAPTA